MTRPTPSTRRRGDLCANGAENGADLSAAVFAYNHSEAYVVEVLDLASSYGQTEAQTVAAGTAPAGSPSTGRSLRSARRMSGAARRPVSASTAPAWSRPPTTRPASPCPGPHKRSTTRPPSSRRRPARTWRPGLLRRRTVQCRACRDLRRHGGRPGRDGRRPVHRCRRPRRVISHDGRCLLGNRHLPRCDFRLRPIDVVRTITTVLRATPRTNVRNRASNHSRIGERRSGTALTVSGLPEMQHGCGPAREDQVPQVLPLLSPRPARHGSSPPVSEDQKNTSR